MNVNDDPEIIWPPLPDVTDNDPQIEYKKLLYQAQLQSITARYESILEHDKAIRASDYPLEQALYNAYLDVAKGQLDRARARAEFVVKAASTIGGAYAVVLGLSFSIGKDVNRPLPIRGLAPTIFLGLSIVLATAYLAYITQPKPTIGPGASPPPSQRMLEERNTFIRWTSEAVLNRSLWLQSAVISLGFGVIFLPVAFLEIHDIIVWPAVLIFVIITLLLPRRESLYNLFKLLFNNVTAFLRTRGIIH